MGKIYWGDNLVYPYIEDKYAIYNPLAPYTENLELWYDFGNTTSYAGSGTVVTDLSGNTNGNLSGSFVYSSSDFDGSIDLQALTYIPVGSTGSVATGTGEWSMTSWIKYRAGDTVSQALMHSQFGGGLKPKIFFYSDGDIVVRFTSSVTNRWDIGFLTGSMTDSWHQLNIVRDANGGISGSIDDNPLIASGYTDTGDTTWFVLGQGDTTLQGAWSGSMATMMFHSEALDDAKIKQTYDYYSQRL